MKGVRLWAEELVKQYNDSGFWYDDLCGMCAITSAELWKRLKNAGIEAEICMRIGMYGSHVFVESGKYVLDVTAQQFSHRNSKITIRPKRLAQVHDYWLADKRFKSARSLLAWQKKEDWPIEQQAMAFTKLLKKVNKRRVK